MAEIYHSQSFLDINTKYTIEILFCELLWRDAFLQIHKKYSFFKDFSLNFMLLSSKIKTINPDIKQKGETLTVIYIRKGVNKKNLFLRACPYTGGGSTPCP